MKKLTDEEILSILAEPNGAEKLCSMRVDTDALLESAVRLFAERGAASALLVRLANKKSLLVGMSQNAELAEAVGKALSCDTPKLRRNAARLAGALKLEWLTDELIAALDKEDQRFVRPSMLLALGSIGGEKAKDYLENYKVAPAADDT